MNLITPPPLKASRVNCDTIEKMCKKRLGDTAGKYTDGFTHSGIVTPSDGGCVNNSKKQEQTKRV